MIPFEHIAVVPLSGFKHRSARDEALADMADLMVESGLIIETMERVDDGWKLTYKFNPCRVTEGVTL